MATVEDAPFLALQVEWLKRNGITDLVFCVGHLHEQIQDYFQDGRRWGVQIKYSVEEQLMGTAGALKLAEQHLRGRFLTINGDSLLEADLGALTEFHEQRKATDPRCLGTMVLTAVPDSRAFGSVRVDEQQRIVSFEEKSARADASRLVSAGIYVFEPELLALIPPATNISLEREIFPSLLRAGFHLFGYLAEGFFGDIGTPQGYQRFREHWKGRQP